MASRIVFCMVLLLAMSLNSICQNNSDCINSLILEGAEPGDADYESSNWIESDQTIASPHVVSYKAVDTIALNPGFEVFSGADFHAFLDPTACIGSSNLTCGVDGATFADVVGPFTFGAELCFDGSVVTVYLDFLGGLTPSGVLVFISNNGGTPAGYGLTEVSPGIFSRDFAGYAAGDLFVMDYMVFQDAGNSPPQYQSGSYSELLIIGCSDGSVDAFTVELESDKTIVTGTSKQLQSFISGGYGILSYEWNPSLGLSNPSIPNPIASPASTTTYTLTVQDGNTCVGSDQITIIVLPNTPACLEQVGCGGYSNTLPSGQIGPSDNTNNPMQPLFTSNLQPPYPTTDWWSSLAFPYYPDQVHSYSIYPRPLCMRADSCGMRIGYVPNPATSTNNYYYGFTHDMTVGIVGLDADETKVSDYSDWTVTADWSDGTLKATTGHGIPYVYCTKNTVIDALISCNNTATVFHDASHYLGITVNGKHYGIFGPQGSSWTQTANAFQSSLNNEAYFSVALLPDNSVTTLEEYADHAFAFVSDTEVSWTYQEATASLVTTFTFTTDVMEGSESETLFALFPHQWKHSTDPLTSHTYASGKGEMKVRKGNSFQTTMVNKGMLPHLPAISGTDSLALYTMVDSMYVNFDLGTGGTYWHGKQLQKMAQLVPIADQVGHTDARDFWLMTLKDDLNDWFSYFCDDETPMFYYDSTVGTLIGFPADFSMNSRLDDHHFHYGYFVMTAAIIAAYDSQWAAEWAPMVELLIDDIANSDRNDTQFPFLRCLDPYAGHSWAGGWSAFPDGNNQESTSEAINFAAAVLKWGAETCQADMESLGMYLYLTESMAAREYWFDVDDTNFPPGYGREYVAIHWGAKADYATWFSGAPEHIHGINYLPITGYSLHLGYEPSYVAQNYAEMETSNGGSVSLWIDVLWNYLALNDASTALQEFNSNYPYQNGEDGESPAHTFHWLTNLNTLGQVDDSIQSDMSHSAVFVNGGNKTYVAYNPGCQSSRTVTFTDGTSFLVESGQLVSYP